ncbi:DUF2868 domain-containing protein [Noviherbaspirillum saxi]|uniref:DUF2868 domain-containing protein n=1 Tax=Noviherbaspirillum saxi TaxID=2320863 RepID=A0A3A3FJX9_9BURK|nr:DUF2868 domain-containing protein [Noviherbaspirillum saxi]RJF91792.1 DUF2868 domain-containing protein [Noviherbaspirillum saxi]
MLQDRKNRESQIARSRAADILIAETIRLMEQSGPLEDQAALREAFRTATGREERLLERARLIGHRLMLDRELERWRELAWFAGLFLALLAFFAAYGSAAAVIGSGRTVNAVTAFFALLAMPMLTLAFWGAATLSGSGSGMFAHLSFGNLLLRLVARLPGERNAHAPMMTNAAHALLRRSRLLPWAFGVVSHAVWAAAFVLILIALWFAFSFQQYRLTWETTILDADFFVRFVTVTGTLPHWLGFPLPDAATLLNPAAPGGDHRAWAWWLIGCAFVYGLLPRVVLGMVSWTAWRRGLRRLHIDTADPYYSKLLARFEEMEQSQVTDPERRQLARHRVAPLASDASSAARVVVGFELPPEVAWPPQVLAQVELLEHIAGAGNERRDMLDKLALLRPRALLVVCHAASTPDRGTERFLCEAARLAMHTALLLITPRHGEGVQRWQGWLEQSGMPIVCFTDPIQAKAWMEGVYG